MGTTAGIVVEYNPFHNGHAYHLEETIRATGAEAVVAVMSGNWLQRGEPALVSKYARAEMALKAGVDLVIELPVAYSTQPAEWFAYGAVSALEATGIIDVIVFGSEAGSAEALIDLAKALHEEPDRFEEALQAELKKGAPYPAAYAAAAGAAIGRTDARHLLAQPNNSLGFHYIAALLRLNSAIRPMTIQRVKAGYAQEHATDESIASATALRKMLLAADSGDEAALLGIAPYVPQTTLAILRREFGEGRGPMHWERYRLPLFHRLLVQTPEQLSAYREVTEGLEYRIKKALAAIPAAATVDALLEALKTKRYTRTKLQRMLASIYLEHRKAELAADVLRKGVPYLRVLGFSERGRTLLKRMKHTSRVSVLSAGPGRGDDHSMLAKDIAATAAYALGFRESSPMDWNSDYLLAPQREMRMDKVETETVD